jgi:hypothetical protein
MSAHAGTLSTSVLGFFCICCFLHLLFSPNHIISGCPGLCSCNGLVRVDREASVLFDCFKLPLWPLSFLARRCACSQAHLFVYVASCRTCCRSQAVCKWFLSHAHILQYVWDKNVYSQRVSSFLLIWSRARGAVQWVPRGATLGFCTLLGTASQGCSQQLVRWPNEQPAAQYTPDVISRRQHACGCSSANHRSTSIMMAGS